MSHVHGGPKPLTDLKNQLESLQDVLLMHPCQHLLLFQYSKTQTSENTFTLPSSDTTDSDTVSDDDLLIGLRKDKRTCTSHLISLYLIHTCFLPFMLYSYSVHKSVSEVLFIPGGKNAMKKEMLALK